MEATALQPAPTLGGRLAQARRFAGLSQNEAAEAVGVSRKTVYSWEQDDTTPPVDKMVTWARRTGFPPAWFIADLGGEPHVPDGEHGSVWAPTLITCDGEHPFDDPSGDASPVPNTPPRAA